MGGNTGSGGVLEAMALPALQRGGYTSLGQQSIGKRPHGGVHKVDLVAAKAGRSILISKKWQQKSGTTDEKVAYEVICLADAVHTSAGKYDKAYLVLGGDGFRKHLLAWYLAKGLSPFIVHHDLVEILTLNQFVARANDGKL
ncbi:MAG: PD-(D/E)XK nuclease superfamily protein [Thermoplasmatota archaeon]